MSAQPAERSTGTATILFTDLVDSTAQRARLDEEAAEALRSTHDRLLVEAVTAHHGTVAKSTGDGIMATFRGAADAVAAGVGIQHANRRPQSAGGRRAARGAYRDQPRGPTGLRCCETG
jgi:class 3 adenylate cyclase